MIIDELASKNGHLMIGGYSVDLAKKYGTPLYVFVLPDRVNKKI